MTTSTRSSGLWDQLSTVLGTPPVPEVRDAVTPDPLVVSPGVLAVLAIDPGSEYSAWVQLVGGVPIGHAKVPNAEVLAGLRDTSLFFDGAIRPVVIEWTAPRGMPASDQLFETLWWVGRFTEAAEHWTTVTREERKRVVRHLTGTMKGGDVNVRAALIDRYGGIGGKEAAIGTKASPGPLHGVKADCWAALGLACTWYDHSGALCDCKGQR